VKIKRNLKKEIYKWIDRPEVIILRGARRVGKTTLMREIFDELEGPKAFLTCDDLDFLSRVRTPDDLVFLLQREYSFTDSSRFYLFLDEFHYLPQATRFIKNLYDRYKYLKMLISGSSAIETIKDIEPLTGRSVEFILYPFGFDEILTAFLKASIEASPTFFRLYRKEIERLFYEYLSYGGFPEVFLEKNEEIRLRWLSEYIHRYVEKDIVHFTRIDNFQAFNNLLRLLASQVGNTVVFSEISNTLGISFPTVTRYINILESTFLIDRVTPFSKNPRSELSKSPKIYFLDIGLRNRLLGINQSVTLNPDIGREVENFAYLTLKQIFDPDRIHYYRTTAGAEIDFVVELNYKKLLLIEVKYRPNPRITPSMRNFIRKYGDKFEIYPIIVSRDTYFISSEMAIIPAPMLIFALRKGLEFTDGHNPDVTE